MPTKVVFTSKHTQGSKTFSQGETAKLSNSLAQRLIKEGKCFRSDVPGAEEKIQEQKQKAKVQEKIEGFPVLAKQLVPRLKMESDPKVLEYFLNDTRKSVQDAAEERLRVLAED